MKSSSLTSLTNAMRPPPVNMFRPMSRLTTSSPLPECRAALKQTRRTHPRCMHPSDRSRRIRLLSSTCIMRQASDASKTNSDTSPTAAAQPQTYYDLFPETFEQGPPPRSSFTPDLRRLRKEFLQLQAKAHPDLAPADLKRQAEGLSARINEAYKTLQDPLRRARYLLSLANIDVEDDSLKMSENELLMEVMEAREAVEEAESEEELSALKAENQQRIDESVRALERDFSTGDLNAAAHHAVRLRYWNNIEESIHGWEQGKGGGIIHH